MTGIAQRAGVGGPRALEGRTIAIIGGDQREQEIARLAATSGATVRGYGFPWPESGIPGVDPGASPEETLEGADYALFPIPGMGTDGTLFAPYSPVPIVPDKRLLDRTAPGAPIILGTADEALRQCAADLGHPLVEYEDDTELMLERAPAIVEGALALAIDHTVVTIHGARIGVVGHGRIARQLARTLVSLLADVHVFARNPMQRADAAAAGCTPHPLDQLASLAPRLDMLFSAVPTRVVDRSVLALLPRGAMVMDLAAPPGGIDLRGAEELGHDAVWGRGLGRRAPVTVGASQWRGVYRRIIELEDGRAREC